MSQSLFRLSEFQLIPHFIANNYLQSWFHPSEFIIGRHVTAAALKGELMVGYQLMIYIYYH